MQSSQISEILYVRPIKWYRLSQHPRACEHPDRSACLLALKPSLNAKICSCRGASWEPAWCWAGLNLHSATNPIKPTQSFLRETLSTDSPLCKFYEPTLTVSRSRGTLGPPLSSYRRRSILITHPCWEDILFLPRRIFLKGETAVAGGDFNPTPTQLLSPSHAPVLCDFLRRLRPIPLPA